MKAPRPPATGPGATTTAATLTLALLLCLPGCATMTTAQTPATPDANAPAPAAPVSSAKTPTAGVAFRDLTYPMAVSYLKLDGMEIAYSDTGPAPGQRGSLLLIHGLGSYMPVWRRNLPVLAAGRRVVAIDLPGYGKSSKGDHRYSMDFFADVVEQVIARLGLQRLVIVGHSMGGQIALTHALRHPGRARGLVLLAPAGLETFAPSEGDWLSKATSKEFVMATPPDGVRRNLANNFVAMPAEAAFMAEDRLRVIGGPDFEAYAQAVSRSVAGMIEGPVFQRLPEISAPALVIFGERDGLIPNPILHKDSSTAAVARRGVERLRGARLELIPQAGHMVQFERPEEVNRLILAFLASLDGAVAAAP